jgi:antitoxin (DNA-binding transcriptional repressor) of toxin-antitoxin stability system
MTTVAKGYLKAHMLEVFRTIEETGEPMVVTDHRKPVLKIIPYQEKRNLRELFDDIRSQVRIKGDLTSPTTDEWGDLA